MFSALATSSIEFMMDEFPTENSPPVYQTNRALERSVTPDTALDTVCVFSSMELTDSGTVPEAILETSETIWTMAS